MPTPQNGDLPSNKFFTKLVTVPRRDYEQQIVKGPDGNPVPDHVLGKFTFKRPTVLERRDIGLRRSQALAGVPAADTETAVLVEVYAVLPYQVHEAPKDWSWEEQYDVWDMVAIYQSYMEGVEEYHTGSSKTSATPAAKPKAENEPPTGIGDTN